MLARLQPGLFAIPLGLLGLAGAWRRVAAFDGPLAPAHDVADALLVFALALLALLLALWAARLTLHGATIRAEWEHPVQGALSALLPVCILLAVAMVVPLRPGLATAAWVFTLASLAMMGVLAWQVVSRLSTGRIPPELVTPALYVPTVAGGLVGALTLSALGQAGWAALLFGMGLSAWALLEMRILNRLFAGPLPPPLRPTLGVEMAPAAVATLALGNLWPLLPAEVLVVSLGIASGPILAVLTRWRYWSAVPFSAGFWSFSFPIAAMAAATAETVRRGGWPAEVAWLAVAIASALIAYLALRTLVLLARGALLPPAAA
jgi:tellurite resistance protein